MIRAVDNKRLDLSDDEYKYYLLLTEKFGDKDFSNLFLTDRNGQITSITPPIERQISLGVMFFILNVMMNQRLRAIGSTLGLGEKSVVDQKFVDNISERLGSLEDRIKKLEEKEGAASDE